MDAALAQRLDDADLAPLLDVLGACVLADRLERDTELVELCNAAQMLAREVAPETVVSRRDVLEWFDANRDRLRALAASPADTRTAMARITDPGLRELAFASIHALCICDYHLADEEADFIKVAEGAWGLRMTPARLPAALDG